MEINLYELAGDDLKERVMEFCGMNMEEIHTQWEGATQEEILADMDTMWPFEDNDSLAEAVYGLVN